MNQAVRWEDAVSSYDTAYLIAKGITPKKRDRPFDAALVMGRLHHQLLPRPAVYARFWTAHQWICANPRGANAGLVRRMRRQQRRCAFTAPADTGWMGCPLCAAYAADTGSTMRQMINAGTPYNLSDHVWLREFTNALVIVNPTTSTQWVTVPAGGWNKIRGFDTAHNSGAAVSSGLSVGRWMRMCSSATVHRRRRRHSPQPLVQRDTDADAYPHADMDADPTPTRRTATRTPTPNGTATWTTPTDANGDIHRPRRRGRQPARQRRPGHRVLTRRRRPAHRRAHRHRRARRPARRRQQ